MLEKWCLQLLSQRTWPLWYVVKDRTIFNIPVSALIDGGIGVYFFLFYDIGI